MTISNYNRKYGLIGPQQQRRFDHNETVEADLFPGALGRMR